MAPRDPMVERQVKAIEAMTHEFQKMNQQLAVLNRSIIKVAIRLAEKEETNAVLDDSHPAGSDGVGEAAKAS